MADVGFPTGYERGFAPRALLALRRRRRELLAGASGRVLDLGGCEGHLSHLGNATSVVVLETPEERGERLRRRAAGAVVPVEVRSVDPGSLARAGERFDTVVAVLALCRAPALDAEIAAIASLLGVEGRLLFLEPTSVRGATGVAQRLAGPVMRMLTSRHLDRDLPAALRAAGLLVTDCERITMPTPWPYRSFVEGAARPAIRTTTVEG